MLIKHSVSDYCIVLVAGFAIISLGYYLAYGRKTFRGPGGEQQPVALEVELLADGDVYKVKGPYTNRSCPSAVKYRCGGVKEKCLILSRSTKVVVRSQSGLLHKDAAVEACY